MLFLQCSQMVIGRQSRTAASARRAAKLAQLRGDAASNGREWLGSALQDVNRKDVREFAQAAGLRVRKAGSDTWLSVGELRAALLEHLAVYKHLCVRGSVCKSICLKKDLCVRVSVCKRVCV